MYGTLSIFYKIFEEPKAFLKICNEAIQINLYPGIYNLENIMITF